MFILGKVGELGGWGEDRGRMWRDMAEKYKSRQEVTNFFFLISNSKIDAMAWSKPLVNNLKIGMNL